MAEAARRRFPPAPGPLGWAAGAALLVVGFLLEFAAVLLLGWFAITRNTHLLVATGVVFVAAVALVTAAALVWRTANKRAGTLKPSSLTPEQQRQLRTGMTIMLADDVLIVGGFLGIALAVHGSVVGRLSLACIPLIAGAIPAYVGLLWMRRATNRPAPRVLRLSPRVTIVVFGLMAVLAALGLLQSGLYLLHR